MFTLSVLILSLISIACSVAAQRFSLINERQFFPFLLMCLDTLAACTYAGTRDWGHVVYWGAAAVLTYAITFMMKGGV